MRFEANEYVMYKYSGICHIESVEKKCFDGINEISYYKLIPVDNNHSSCYVPIENAEEKIRPLLDKKEIYSIIDSMPEEDEIWIDNNRERKVMFDKILKSDDYRIIIGMAKAIYSHKKENLEKGKNISASDELAMNNVEKLMYQEFSIVLGISFEEVEKVIEDRLQSA